MLLLTSYLKTYLIFSFVEEFFISPKIAFNAMFPLIAPIEVSGVLWVFWVHWASRLGLNLCIVSTCRDNEFGWTNVSQCGQGIRFFSFPEKFSRTG